MGGSIHSHRSIYGHMHILTGLTFCVLNFQGNVSWLLTSIQSIQFTDESR